MKSKRDGLGKFMTEQHREQREQHREEMVKLIARLATGQASSSVAFPPVAMTTPSFAAYDSMSELWKDYWPRFQICVEANSLLTERQLKVFLQNQSKATFKLISIVAAQMATPKEIENLTVEEIVAFMDEQYASPENSLYRYVSGFGPRCNVN